MAVGFKFKKINFSDFFHFLFTSMQNREMWQKQNSRLKFEKYSRDYKCADKREEGIIFYIQCLPLNRITLGQHASDNNKRMFQLTDLFCVLSRYNGTSNIWLQ